MKTGRLSLAAVLACACAALLAACSSSPTAPSGERIVDSVQKATAGAAWFDKDQLGHATYDGQPFTVGLLEVPGICYQRDFFLVHGVPMFIVFNAKDRNNQIDVGHFPFVTEHFTMSDFQNGPLAADSNFWCIPSAVPPTPPAPPVTPPIPPILPVPPVPPVPPVNPPPPPPPNPPPDPPVIVPTDGCPGTTVRPFDSLTARSVTFDVVGSNVTVDFSIFAGGSLFSHIGPLTFIQGHAVTLAAPGGYFHQSFSCVDRHAVVTLVGTGGVQ